MSYFDRHDKNLHCKNDRQKIIFYDNDPHKVDMSYFDRHGKTPIMKMID